MTRRNWLFDGVVAGTVLVLGQLEVWSGAGASHAQGPPAAEALVYGVAAMLLVFRRVAPMRILTAIVVVYAVGFAAFGSPEGLGVTLAPAVAVYSVARWERRHPAWWGLAVVVLLGLVQIWFDPLSASWADRLLALVWLSPWVVSWLVGALVRSQLANADERRLRQRERASLAVAEERTRIARELHDVLGHSVSVMTVQASAVRRRLRPDQVAEREALESVESVGREALREMRSMVGALRETGEQANRQPPPRLADVDRMAEQFRSAGLPVVLSVSGEPGSLAPGLDATAYRLVQEGLTNALRHAVAPTRADVNIEYSADVVRIAVLDDGQPVNGQMEAGHGLLGMRERVAVYGGELLARPRAAGGFELRATLPWTPA